MSSVAQSIGDMPVTIRLAMKMEDSLQAFAVRAACFIGELGVPFSEEFDDHDYGATHVIAYLGEEPIGAVRVRWFKSFAMTERLAVLPRFRGHRVGQQLLERCRTLAQGRGCNMLYAQVLPSDAGYWEMLGWRRLVPAAQSKSDPDKIVAMIKATDPAKALSEIEPPKAITLRSGLKLGSSDKTLGTCTH